MVVIRFSCVCMTCFTFTLRDCRKIVAEVLRCQEAGLPIPEGLIPVKKVKKVKEDKKKKK